MGWEGKGWICRYSDFSFIKTTFSLKSAGPLFYKQPTDLRQTRRYSSIHDRHWNSLKKSPSLWFHYVDGSICVDPSRESISATRNSVGGGGEGSNHLASYRPLNNWHLHAHSLNIRRGAPRYLHGKGRKTKEEKKKKCLRDRNRDQKRVPKKEQPGLQPSSR